MSTRFAVPKGALKIVRRRVLHLAAGEMWGANHPFDEGCVRTSRSTLFRSGNRSALHCFAQAMPPREAQQIITIHQPADVVDAARLIPRARIRCSRSG